jgi:uncharacterized membrane protein YdfJ with MMPL/SSD domain
MSCHVMLMCNSMVVSWSIMYGVAMSGFDVASVAPSIMSSLVIAMSIDYCLFQLTRLVD